MDTITLNEAIVSHLIGMRLIDETNPQRVREYATKALNQLNISAVDFYTKEYEIDEVDELIFKLVG